MYATAHTPESFVANPREAIINIAIADDYPLLLAGMRQILAPCDDIVVVAECTRMPDLLAQVALKRPEIILFGCESNRDNLAQHLHSISERHSAVKVIVFTGNPSLDFHEEALRNGVKGVLLKHCAPDLVAKTIRKVSRGGLCFDRALTDRMLSTFVRRKRPNFHRKLPESHLLPNGRTRSSAAYAKACAIRKSQTSSTLAMPRLPTTLPPSIANSVSRTV